MRGLSNLESCWRLGLLIMPVATVTMPSWASVITTVPARLIISIRITGVAVVDPWRTEFDTKAAWSGIHTNLR